MFISTVNGTNFNNTTTETLIFPSITIPANFMADGRALRLTVRGKISNVVTTPGNLDFKIRWGGVAGTILSQTSATALSTTANTDVMFSIYNEIVVRANGSSGSVLSMGEAYAGNLSVLATMLMGSAGGSSTNTPAAVTVDLTADTALSVTGHFSVANASNSITGMEFILEVLN
jgi:hypothetical protein